MSYYDETFEPWKIVDGQCVVADEAEWQKVDHVTDGYFEKAYLHNPGGAKIGEHPKRPIVKIATDVFDDRVKRPVVSTGGVHCFDLAGESESVGGLLNRFFQTIDATPHVDYLIVTQRPELVRKMWPSTPGISGSHPANSFEEAESVPYRPNVILATYLETKADVERLVPELSKCHDLCKGLAIVCNPREALDLWPFCYGPCPNSDHISMDPETGMYECCSGCEWSGHNDEMVIDLIIAEGNEHPIHPDWLRSLRDQCKDANVPFHFARWGEYQHGTNSAHPMNECHVFNPDGPWMEKVGKERSGRLLDGQEHNGMLEVGK